MKLARSILLWGALAGLLGGLAWMVSHSDGQAGHESGVAGKSLAGTALEWPSRETIRRVLSLADHNTRAVATGVAALGAAGGLVGTFLLLRKRSLLSDTVSHCTLPGIAIAFLLAENAGGGRSLPVLLLGAAGTGALGMALVAAIRARSRVKDDAALAIVLSVFFGLGIALMVVIQQLPTGNAAGLANFIYGKTASMTAGDARLILFASLVVALACAALFKEFKLLCFDFEFARAQGWPVTALDLALMGLVVAVTVIGLQAVGMLLVVAMLIIPAAAARFWSHRLGVSMLLAAGIGAMSGLAGVAASALFPKLPAGAIIVLAAVFCFAASFVFGAERGLCQCWWQQRRVSRRVARQHLLRALYEWCEAHADAASHGPGSLLDRAVEAAELRRANGWSEARLKGLLRTGFAERLVSWSYSGSAIQLTAQGKIEARRATRNHRLWETFLLRYADVAPQHIHHNADQIEHVIEPDIVNELEELLAAREGASLVPANPEQPRAGVSGGLGL